MFGEFALRHQDLAAPAKTSAAAHRVDVHTEAASGLQQGRADRKIAALAGGREYHERIASHQIPSTNGFYLLYFVLTGLHLFHLLIGLAVLTALWLLAAKPESTTNQWAFFEGGACFWHMVDLLWLVLFALIFLVR